MLDGSWLTAFPGQKAKEEKTPKYSRHKATTKSRGPYENLTTYSQTTGPAHCATSFLFFFPGNLSACRTLCAFNAYFALAVTAPSHFRSQANGVGFPFSGIARVACQLYVPGRLLLPSAICTCHTSP